MSQRRVVVTGMGLITPLGNDVATSWSGFVAGRSGVTTIEAFDPSRLTSRVAGEVHDLDASHVLDRKDQRRTDDDTLVLVCHASPGSQTAGFDQGLEASVTIERVARTDARVIVCGHTHLPEVRDLGWKLIVNDGSAGYVFDGDPTASWALVDVDGGEVHAEIRRTTFDVLSVANAISARGLAGDVYRAATVRTGKLVR